MKKIMSSVFFLVLVLFGIIFAVLNSDMVALNYYFDTQQVPLSLIMLLSMIIGTVIGVLVSMAQLLKARRDVSKLKKQVQLAEKEVSNLRTIPIKDSH
ncbi:MAG: LapA family protein [Gammaproteobacteria bacterium]|nr:LapA family protein [Gammaproteobacteria bacterium]MDH5777763.1 LapA family protein [Gammaproteobacteria bacterium]